MRISIMCGFVIGLSCSSVSADRLLETLIVSGIQPEDQLPLTSSNTRIDRAAQLPGLRIDSAELLQGLPGVQSDSRSNYAQDTRVTLRGFGARSAFGVRGIDLSVDGIPLTTPDGQGQLSNVYLDEIAAVEVLRGPVAALYGNGAGGVIALQTRAPTDKSLGVKIVAGENDLLRRSAQAQWREGQLAARAQFSRFDADGERAHSSAEREQAGAQLYYTSQGGIEAVLRLDSSRDPLLQDPLGLTPEQWREDPTQQNPASERFNTRKEINHRQTSLSLRQATGNDRWQAALWRGTREIRQYLAFAGSAITSAGGVVDLERDFSGISGNYSHDFALLGSPATATVGVELAGTEDRRQGYINEMGVPGPLRRDELGEVESRDVYSLIQWQPAERWQLFMGARHSDVEFEVKDYFIVEGNPDDSGGKDFDEWSSALGVSYQLNQNWSLFASSGRGFETPTLTETAYRNNSTGLNTALEASRNRQHEAGLRFAENDMAEFTLSIFSIDTTDEIVVDQSLDGRTTYRNAADTERRGAELEGNLIFSEAWSARVSVNYIEAEYSAGDWDDNFLPGVARKNHYGQVRWQPLLNEHLTLSLAVQHRSKVATADDNQIFAPAATTADFAVSSRFTLGDWDLSGWLKLANLADKDYVGSVIVNQGNGRSFEAASGRNVSAGVHFNYRF